MSGAWVMVSAVLLAQAEPTPVDPDAALDVSKVDVAPESPREARERLRPLHEALTAESAARARSIAIQRGAALSMPVELVLSRAPQGPVALRLTPRDRTRALGPALSGAQVERGSQSPPPEPPPKRVKPKKRRRKLEAGRGSASEVWLARGEYLARSFARGPELTRPQATLEVIELDSGQVLGRLELAHELRALPPVGTPALVEQLEAAARYFDERRAEARATLERAAGGAALSSPELLQPGRLSGASFVALSQTIGATWRHEVAMERLRALAQTSDQATAEAAILAVGRLEPRAEAGREPSRGPVRSELDALRAQLAELALERSERTLGGLKRRADLSRAELAELSSLDGALAAVRGERAAAERAFGQALCLEPALESPDPRPPARQLFEAVRAEARCPVALHARPPEAYLITTAAGHELHVRLEVGPDPYGVVAGGSVLLFGGGGGVLAEAKVRAEGTDPRVLTAAFPNDEGFRNMAGELLVQAVAKSVSGVALASVGDPVPVRLEVGEHEDYSEGVPWWVWLGGGILVVAGAGVATALLVPREEVRGIGPIDVSF